MANPERLFAQRMLAAWCRGHGIYEIRAVLSQAAGIAQTVDSAELLAEALESLESPPADAEPSAEVPAEPAEAEQGPVAKKRRARGPAGQFKADDPATETVNEAWAGDDQ